MNNKEEQVWVIKSKLLSKLKDNSILNTNQDDLEYLLEDCFETAMFLPRSIAEKSPEYKQIIPYGFITNGEKILSYQRTKKSGENRLHDNFSIGFGGHINPEDTDNIKENFDIFANAFHRELNEELEWGRDIDQYESSIVGIINDNSNSVGEVHLGIVLKVNALILPTEKENTITNLEWLDSNEFALFKYENWSQILLRHLKG